MIVPIILGSTLGGNNVRRKDTYSKVDFWETGANRNTTLHKLDRSQLGSSL